MCFWDEMASVQHAQSRAFSGSSLLSFPHFGRMVRGLRKYAFVPRPMPASMTGSRSTKSPLLLRL